MEDRQLESRVRHAVLKRILNGPSQTSWTSSQRQNQQSFDYNDKSVLENSTGKRVNWQQTIASG